MDFPDGAALIVEFDREVDSRCELIRTNAENIGANLLSTLDLTLQAIPERVRKMPVKELMEKFNGDIQKAADYCATQQTATKKRAPTPTMKPAKSPTTVKKEPPVKASLSRAKAATKPNPTPNKSPLPRSPVKKRGTPLATKSPRRP